MRDALGLLGVALVLTAAAACGSSSASSPEDPKTVDDGGVVDPTGEGGATADPPRELPCDVDAILNNPCRNCHAKTPQFGAPMPLVTHADLTAPAPSDPTKKVYELIPGRIDSDASPMPPSPNPRLSPADRAVLKGWVAAGAPKSADVCGTKPSPVGVGGVTCTPDLTIAPATPYTMPASGDQYVCYGVELTRPSPTHITAFAVGSSRVDLQACKLEYSIVSPK